MRYWLCKCSMHELRDDKNNVGKSTFFKISFFAIEFTEKRLSQYVEITTVGIIGTICCSRAFSVDTINYSEKDYNPTWSMQGIRLTRHGKRNRSSGQSARPWKAFGRTLIVVHMVITRVVGFITSKTDAVPLMTNVKTVVGVNRTILVGVWRDGVAIIAPRNLMKFAKTDKLSPVKNQ